MDDKIIVVKTRSDRSVSYLHLFDNGCRLALRGMNVMEKKTIAPSFYMDGKRMFIDNQSKCVSYSESQQKKSEGGERLACL